MLTDSYNQLLSHSLLGKMEEGQGIDKLSGTDKVFSLIVVL